jgi:two-component system, NtrC family, sensor kinase
MSIRKRTQGSGVAAAKARRPTEAPPISKTEVSSSHAFLSGQMPRGWLDRLLVATADLPLQRGERAVVEGLVECVSGILTSHAVGVCVVPERAAGPAGLLVYTRLPAGRLDSRSSVDPARMFPGMKFEYVAAVPGSVVGSTLHLGSDLDDLDPEGSPAVALLDRAALVLGLALPKARAVSALASGAQRNAKAFDKRMIQIDKLATFGELAAGVVHELNNPLTSIVAYSEYLVRKVIEEGSVHEEDDVERLRRVRDSANRMLRLSRELVGYARPSGGARGPCALHSVIDQAVAFCEHVLSTNGVGVERQYLDEDPMVRATSEQIVQVFVNLLTNACQAAPRAGGRIVLTTTRAEGGARGRIAVAVEDNGSGIAPENLPHVFAPFFTTKRSTHGIGLGLSITKNIVEDHGGTIRVESLFGHGTRFLIDLPALG